MKTEYFPAKELTETVDRALASQSAVYQTAWKGVEHTPGTLFTKTAWEQLPLIDKATIQPIPLWDRLATEKGEVEYIRHTYGTTAKRVLVTPRREYGSSGDLLAGLSINCLMNFFGSGNYGVPRSTLGVLQVQGDSAKLAESAAVIKRLGVDAMFMTPYSAMKLAEFLRGDPALARIKVLSFCGEVTSKKQLTQLQQLYPNAVMLNNYAASEIADVAAVTCPHDRGTEQCLRVGAQTDLFYIELVDGAGNVIETEGTLGEVVVTTLEPVPVPMIRYKVGDLAMYSARDCSCEQIVRGFVVLGRKDTAPILIGRGEISLEAVDRALETVGIRDYEYFEIVVGEEMQGDLALTQATVKLYSKTKTGVLPEVIAVDFAQALEVYPKYFYQDGVHDGYYLPLKMEWQTDPHSPTSSKGPYSKMIRINES